MGVAGAVVGVSGGAVVAGMTAGGDVVAGVGWVPAAWLGVAAAFGGVLADVEHVGLGDGLVAATLPFEPVPLPWPPGIRWPVPLLLAPPPAPVADCTAGRRGADVDDRVPDPRHRHGGAGKQENGGQGQHRPQPRRAESVVGTADMGTGGGHRAPPGATLAARGEGGAGAGRGRCGRCGYRFPRRILPAPPGLTKKPGHRLRSDVTDPVAVPLSVHTEAAPEGEKRARPQPLANLAQAILGEREPGRFGVQFTPQQPAEVVVRRGHVVRSPSCILLQDRTER